MVMKGLLSTQTHTNIHTHTTPLTTVNRPIYVHLWKDQKDIWEQRPRTEIHTDDAPLCSVEKSEQMHFRG